MRATRFPLQLGVRYREPGQVDWQVAQTANVSASGVLVQSNDVPEINTSLEFRLTLARASGPPSQGEVAGLGRVVRLVLPPERPLFCGFALAIDEYIFSSAPMTPA